MLIRIGFDIELEVAAPTALIHMLQVHPARASDLQGGENLFLSPALPTDHYLDGFGNRCARVRIPAGVGSARLLNVYSPSRASNAETRAAGQRLTVSGLVPGAWATRAPGCRPTG